MGSYFFKPVNERAMRTAKYLYIVLFVFAISTKCYSQNFKHHHEDIFIVNNEDDLDLLKSYISIKVLKTLHISDPYYDDSHLDGFIAVLNEQIVATPEKSLIVYTNRILHVIEGIILDKKVYTLTFNQLEKEFHNGHLIDLVSKHKVALRD